MNSSEILLALLFQGWENLSKFYWLTRSALVYWQTLIFATRPGQESCPTCFAFHLLVRYSMSSVGLVGDISCPPCASADVLHCTGIGSWSSVLMSVPQSWIIYLVMFSETNVWVQWSHLGVPKKPLLESPHTGVWSLPASAVSGSVYLSLAPANTLTDGYSCLVSFAASPFSHS